MKRAELLGTRPIYDGRVVKLSVDRVRLPNDQECDLEMIRHPGAAAVVPLHADGDVTLVRQYRHAVDGWLLEVPAGKLDPGESPESCAGREMEEEIGFRAGELVSMGPIWPAPGFADERIWLFVARRLESSETAHEDHEVLTPERMPFDRAIEMIARGEIQDAKSICALFRAREFID